MRTALTWAVSLSALAAAAAPAVVAYALGPSVSAVFPDVLGAGSGLLFFLTLIYVIWLPATVYGLIWALDRIGVHYAAERRPRRLSARMLRRRRAGLRFLEAGDRARTAAAEEAVDRSRRPRDARGVRSRRHGEGSE